MEASELAKQIGDVLTCYMKTGPLSPDHDESVLDAITDSVACSIDSVSEAVDRYTKVCDEFMAAVDLAQGMPLRAVGGVKLPQIANRAPPSDRLDALREQVQDRYRFCIENFQKQAEKCFDEEIVSFREEVAGFLRFIPAKGTKDKVAKAMLADVKKSVKSLAKWNQLFYTYKAMSFPEEIEFLFTHQSDPIAAVWHFSSLDDQCDFRMEHDHRALSGTIYLVRDSWAMEKGYLDKDSAPYIEDVVRPKQDIGCMCSLTWLYNLRDLPDRLLTDYGHKVLEQVRVR